MFLLMVSLSRSVTTQFRTPGLGGRFLAWPQSGVLGCPGQSTGGPIWGFCRFANFPHDPDVRSASSVGFPFSLRAGSGVEATPVLLLSPTRRRPRLPSPLHRFANPVSSVTYRVAYRPSDGVGLHRSWSRTIFSRRPQAAPTWPVADNRTPGHERTHRTIPDASD